MFELNTEHFPLVVGFPGGELTCADIDRMVTLFSAVHERRERILVLTDSRASRMPNATIRKAVADAVKKLEADSLELTIASAVVVPNGLIAGAIRAVNWFMRKEVAPAFHSTAAAALDHLLAEGTSENLELPETARDFCAQLDAADGDIGALRRLGAIPSVPVAPGEPRLD